MKILTYLAFTLLSVLIQFCVIDYIQAKLEIDEMKPKPKPLNVTSQKKQFSDLIKEYGNKPHALYYRTDNTKLQKQLLNMLSTTVYSNETQSENPMTTENSATSTVYDILYEDNVTSFSESTTTDLPFATTELENVTDLAIFNTNNATDAIPTPRSKKKLFQDYCYCNLLYHLCDINCCCDGDCTDNERSLFNCTEKGIHGQDRQEQAYSCSAPGNERPFSSIDSLFCVVKTNLPEKRNTIHKKYNAVEVSKLTKNAMKWHDNSETRHRIALSPKFYSPGDTVLVLRNNTVTYIDFPLSKINGHCDSRAPIYFLSDQHVQCNVVLRELEMFNILKTIEETKVISVKSMNTSNLDCSELHCTNLKIKVCNETTCTNYTRDWHEPYCMENQDVICQNIAVKVEYAFYYWDSKIVDALLHFHIQTVLPKVQFIRQEISVKFYLAEDSTNKFVSLSGNSGYLKGFPLIASFENDSYTRNFFNSSKLSSTLNYPGNKNGICLFTNTTNFVNFGSNKRNKCRYIVKPSFTNATENCEDIYKNIKNILGISRRTVISQLGNPHGLNDEDWIVLFMDDKLQQMGKLRGVNELMCYHMVTKVSLYFGFADVSEVVGKEKFKILTASAYITTQNITFTDEHSSVILTFETNFADVTKPPAYEYAGSPQLNIHLPKDFFFPFPSNKCNIFECNFAFLVTCLISTFIPK